MKTEPRLIRARVTTDSRKESILEGDKRELIIEVKEPSKDNRANERVRFLIARHLRLPEASVRIVSGHHKGSKIIGVK